MTAPITAGLEQNGVHGGFGLDAGSTRLQPLGTPDLGAVGADHGVVGHVLGLEGGDADAPAGEPPADPGGDEALPGIGGRAGDQQAAHRTLSTAGRAEAELSTDRRTAPCPEGAPIDWTGDAPGSGGGCGRGGCGRGGCCGGGHQCGEADQAGEPHRPSQVDRLRVASLPQPGPAFHLAAVAVGAAESDVQRARERRLHLARVRARVPAAVAAPHSPRTSPATSRRRRAQRRERRTGPRRHQVDHVVGPRRGPAEVPVPR